MMESLIDRIQKLFAVKSIVTLALTAVFCVMCLDDMIGADQFMAIFTMVIGFYFGTQAERKNSQTVETAIPVIEEGIAESTSKPEGADV